MKKNFTILSISLIVVSFFAMIAHSYDNISGYSYSRYNDTGEIAERSANSDELLFIVDYSNSMNEMLFGRAKIDYVREIVSDTVKSFTSDKKVGLRIFGHNLGGVVNLNEIRRHKEQICSASNLILPIAPYNASSIRARLSEYEPKGATPIEYSLRSAVNYDFNPSSRFKHIILITDGEENCGNDPCMYVRNLMRTRNDIRIDVIGITAGQNAYSQLHCIADAAFGKYYDVKSPDEFRSGLKIATQATYPPVKPMNNSSLQINNNARTFKSGIRYRNYAVEVND